MSCQLCSGRSRFLTGRRTGASGATVSRELFAMDLFKLLYIINLLSTLWRPGSLRRSQCLRSYIQYCCRLELLPERTRQPYSLLFPHVSLLSKRSVRQRSTVARGTRPSAYQYFLGMPFSTSSPIRSCTESRRERVLRRSSFRTPPLNLSGRLRQVPAGEAQQKRGP